MITKNITNFFWPKLLKTAGNIGDQMCSIFQKEKVHFALPHFLKKYFNLMDQAFTAGLASWASSLALLSPSLFYYFFIEPFLYSLSLSVNLNFSDNEEPPPHNFDRCSKWNMWLFYFLMTSSLHFIHYIALITLHSLHYITFQPFN